LNLLPRLDKAQQRLGFKPLLRAILDSTSKWSSSLLGLEREWQLRRAYQEVAATHALVEAVATPEEFLCSRQFAGVLRPFHHATSILQGLMVAA